MYIHSADKYYETYCPALKVAGYVEDYKTYGCKLNNWNLYSKLSTIQVELSTLEAHMGALSVLTVLNFAAWAGIAIYLISKMH